jgi:hypothetical protein
MTYQDIFKRYELKFLITDEQLKRMQEVMREHVERDRFGRSAICNLYYDTPDFLLIRRSLDKPFYKEKLRVRSYGVASSESTVFAELKKKYDGIVYKRRISMTESQSVEFLQGRLPPQSQISREIAYMFEYYKMLAPAVHLSYKREAFYGKEDKNLRITFDSEILYRTYDLSLQKGIYGSPILSDGTYLMEIKTATAIPLWLTAFLSREKIMKTSFSKYGKAYISIYHKLKKGEQLYA